MIHAAALFIVVLGLGGCCGHSHQSGLKGPRIAETCGDPAAAQLTPAPDSQLVEELRKTQSNGAPALSGGFLTAHCQTKWQDLVETIFCHKQVKEYCESTCAEGEPRKSCLSGRGHEPLMNQCRRQSLVVFTSGYPACAGFLLCRNKLVPPSTTCS